MALSESKIRSRKPPLTYHHSDSIIMVLQTKTVKRSAKAARLANCLCQLQSQIGPESACHRRRNLFYNVRNAHENVPPPSPGSIQGVRVRLRCVCVYVCVCVCVSACVCVCTHALS